MALWWIADAPIAPRHQCVRDAPADRQKLASPYIPTSMAFALLVRNVVLRNPCLDVVAAKSSRIHENDIHGIATTRTAQTDQQEVLRHLQREPGNSVRWANSPYLCRAMTSDVPSPARRSVGYGIAMAPRQLFSWVQLLSWCRCRFASSRHGQRSPVPDGFLPMTSSQ